MGTQLELLLVVLCLMNKLALAQLSDPMNETYMTKPRCPYRCSGGYNVTIPYPFGIGLDCALNEAFVIYCNYAFNPPRPYSRNFGDQPVISIQLEDMKVVVEVTTFVYINVSRNSQLAYTVPIMLDWPIHESCQRNPSCSSQLKCYSYRSNATFSCSCNEGYEGNPYLPYGCQDIDECAHAQNIEYCTRGCVNTQGSFICKTPSKKAKMAMIGTGSGVGTILLLLGLWQVYKMIKRRNKIKLKRKFFQRNGGLLLQKQLSSGEEGNVEKIKLFTSKDLEKATDRYNKNRILGQGGQGTVYKGTLTDGRIVAIKVSAIVDERNLEQFINEVVILSQINHRNVVKLHGCCLETEVPLLVYEFIPNGTLFQYIHDKNEDFPLTWDVRLRIAIEVASALSYLHSAASVPIYHRDIKSTNILLDEKYKAKVADFGTSRSIAIDQTHLTTRVSGTFGYLDPEYFQSSQFTEKSDVYSFGVVLVELLTSQKPISSTRSEESRSLTTYFMDALKEKCIFDILDAQVQKEAGKEEITRVINLAKRCLNLSGRKRPTMREVTMKLEGITIPNGTSTFDERDEEGEYEVMELVVPFETSILTSRAYSDAHPIIFE